MKANYAESGGKIDLELKNGLFVPIKGLVGLDKLAAEAKADDVFLTLVKRYNAQERNAADKKRTSYAPALFAKEPDSQGVTSGQLEAAMLRLFKAGKIKIVSNGPRTRPARTIVPAELE